MMKNFNSAREWLSYTKTAIIGIAVNVGRLIYSLIKGIYSLALYIILSIEGFCKREPKAAMIIGFIIVFLSVGWILSYVNGRTQLITALYERDSVSILIDRINQYK